MLDQRGWQLPGQLFVSLQCTEESLLLLCFYLRWLGQHFLQKPNESHFTQICAPLARQSTVTRIPSRPYAAPSVDPTIHARECHQMTNQSFSSFTFTSVPATRANQKCRAPSKAIVALPPSYVDHCFENPQNSPKFHLGPNKVEFYIEESSLMVGIFYNSIDD